MSIKLKIWPSLTINCPPKLNIKLSDTESICHAIKTFGIHNLYPQIYALTLLNRYNKVFLGRRTKYEGWSDDGVLGFSFDMDPCYKDRIMDNIMPGVIAEIVHNNRLIKFNVERYELV